MKQIHGKIPNKESNMQTTQIPQTAETGWKESLRKAPVILGISGSLRDGSTTRLAVEAALRGAHEAGAETRLINLKDYRLPLAGGDEQEYPDTERLRGELAAADGFVWGTPEYHGSFSGVLKNALDLTSGEVFDGKAVGLVGVSGGAQGATHGLAGLRTIARSLHAWVVPDQASVPEAGEAFDRNGAPRSAALDKRLREVGRQVARLARVLGAPDTL